MDPSIYLMSKESGGFGTGAVQMKALPSAANTVSVTGIEKDGRTDSATNLEHVFFSNTKIVLSHLS